MQKTHPQRLTAGTWKWWIGSDDFPFPFRVYSQVQNVHLPRVYHRWSRSLVCPNCVPPTTGTPWPAGSNRPKNMREFRSGSGRSQEKQAVFDEHQEILTLCFCFGNDVTMRNNLASEVWGNYPERLVWIPLLLLMMPSNYDDFVILSVISTWPSNERIVALFCHVTFSLKIVANVTLLEVKSSGSKKKASFFQTWALTRSASAPGGKDEVSGWMGPVDGEWWRDVKYVAPKP